jgi:hypothetical protein
MKITNEVKDKKQSKFKNLLLSRIERHAVKTNLEGEVVYLKKSIIPLIGDWGRIYPPINEDDSYNWVNIIFGGKKNFIKLLIVLAIIGCALFGYYEVFSSYNQLASTQCVQTCLNIAKGLP